MQRHHGRPTGLYLLPDGPNLPTADSGPRLGTRRGPRACCSGAPMTRRYAHRAGARSAKHRCDVNSSTSFPSVGCVARNSSLRPRRRRRSRSATRTRLKGGQLPRPASRARMMTAVRCQVPLGAPGVARFVVSGLSGNDVGRRYSLMVNRHSVRIMSAAAATDEFTFAARGDAG
jgi:hypothetical protein